MPTIGNLGTMFVRDKDGRMVPVPCIQGKNGITPHIGENGNWWIGDTDTGAMADNKKYPVSASVYEKIFSGKPSEYTLEILLKDGERIRAELPNMGLTNDDVVEIGTGEPSEFDDINYKQFYLDKNTGRLYINTSKIYPNSYITIGGVVMSGENDPTGGEDAYINNLYINTTTGAIFLCVRMERFMPSEPPHPVWQQIGGTGVDVGTDITLGITGAVVGQTVKITEVDEDGNPVKWGSADIPAQTDIDSTLSIEGSAADAKAVGDKLTEVSGAVVEQGKTIPKVFDWAKAELPFTESEISDTATGAGFVVNPKNYADGKTYFRYHAGQSYGFRWTNPNPQKGSLTITMRGYSQYSVMLSTKIVTVYTDGTDNSLKDMMYLTHGNTVTYTTDPDKTVDYIRGNYDFENWVLLDMDVLSIVADYPAPTGTVKSVNGNLPDENGNVDIDIPEGGGGSGGTDIALGISGAVVGQTVKITEVDEDGNPVKWGSADIPAQTDIDSTLSIEGSAADAKAVGDKLTEVSGAIADETTAREQAISDLEAKGVQQTPLFAQGDTLEECLAWLDENGDTTKVYAMKKEVSPYLYGCILTEQEVTTGENILHTLTPLSGTTLGSNGLCFGYRPSTESPYYTGATNYSMTGIIPATVDDAPFNFYVKGITSWGSATGERLALFCRNNAIAYARKLAEGISGGLFSVTQLDTDYFRFTVNKAYFDAVTWSDVTGIVVSFSNTTEGQNIIVSLTPIEKTTVTGYQFASTGHAFVPADYEDRIIDIEGRTTSLENRVDELSVGTDGTFTYVADEAKRVADIVQANRTVGSLTFTAMSDFHVAVGQTSTWGLENNLTSCRDAGLGLTELQKHLKLDFTAMLGDFTWAGNAELVSQVKKDLTYVKNRMTNGMKDVPNIWCTGNHDINYGANTDRRMSEDEMYAYLTSNNKWTVQDGDNIGRNYGYIDFENQKIRCIYLNTVDAFDYPDNTDGTADDAMEITAVQAQWLVDVGLDFSDKPNPTEWGVVALSHHCLCQFQPVTAILTAYRDGASGSTSITTNGVTTDVNYDFTNENRGEIICAIHGHDHNFTYRKISTERWDNVTEANAWLWSICVPNMDTTRNNEKATSTDEAYKQAFGEFDSEGNPVYYPKTQGTATSTSFCVITIDRKNRKVHAIAYGAGTDRVVDY